MAADTPAKATGLIANKGIEFLSWATPSGYKVAWILQELHDVYGLEFTAQSIDLPTFVQKEPWYLKINPNGKIPAIVDHDNGGLQLWQSTVIMGYLVNKYDKQHLFSFPHGTKEYYDLLLALEFSSSDLGPAQGLATQFYRLDQHRDPYGTQKLVGEVERCYAILDRLLEGRDYIVGEGQGKFTIADMAFFSQLGFSWLCGAAFLGDMSKWPHLRKWFVRIRDDKSDVLSKVTEIPLAPKGTNRQLKKGYEEDAEVKKREDGLRAVLEEGRKEFGYVYQTA